uniref:NHR domain-containing protein n=1 Tax=Parascaris equorum TaxID=6256 RepID=A0A914RC95_PAREQ
MINQGTSEWPLPQLTFHQVHGANIQILRGGRVAKRKESFCKGLAFSNFLLLILKNTIRFACPDLTSKDGYWAKALPERYSVEGSILHFYVNNFLLKTEEVGKKALKSSSNFHASNYLTNCDLLSFFIARSSL